MKLRRSACIDTLYLELPFLDRFQAAKEDGFDAVEFWSWADRDLSAVKSASDRAGIPVCGFNGDADLSLIDPAQREAYLAFLHRSLEAARFLGASGVTVHSNGLGLGGVVLAPREDLSHTVKLCSLYAGLAASARLAEEAGVTLYLEPLNISTDHPGNFLRDTQTAAELVRLIGSPRLKVLYDIYHMQLSEGNLMGNIRAMSTRQTPPAAVSPVPGRSPSPGSTRRWRPPATQGWWAMSCFPPAPPGRL